MGQKRLPYRESNPERRGVNHYTKSHVTLSGPFAESSAPASTYSDNHCGGKSRDHGTPPTRLLGVQS